MAANLLPLALLGAGAAIVVSREKKKRAEAAEEVCPPIVNFKAEQLASIDARAQAKYGDKQDPSAQANFALNEMLPSTCKRSSVGSKIRVVFAPDNQVDIGIPDTYMMLFGNLLSSRVDGGQGLDGDAAMKLWARELDWYKKATGSDFNPRNPAFQAFAEGFGKAMLEALGNLKKPPAPPSGPPCPKEVIFDFLEPKTKKASEEVGAMINGGTHNPFTLADHIFSVIFPSGCKKTNQTTNVKIYEDIEGKLVAIVTLALLYANLVIGIAGTLEAKGYFKSTDYLSVRGLAIHRYEQLTGKKFQEIDM